MTHPLNYLSKLWKILNFQTHLTPVVSNKELVTPILSLRLQMSWMSGMSEHMLKIEMPSTASLIHRILPRSPPTHPPTPFVLSSFDLVFVLGVRGAVNTLVAAWFPDLIIKKVFLLLNWNLPPCKFYLSLFAELRKQRISHLYLPSNWPSNIWKKYYSFLSLLFYRQTISFLISSCLLTHFQASSSCSVFCWFST